MDRKSQSGQALVEYILLLTIVVGGLGYFVHKVTETLDLSTAKYGGRIEKELRTGSAPPTIWKK